jgi:glycosyltransferase involved in cell wall biosynthesis
MAQRARAPVSSWGRSGGPRVLYFSRIEFPSPKANSIQSFHTCLAMAREGADVLFVVRKLVGSRRECFAYYGEPEHPRLRFTSLSLPMASEFNDWRGTSFRLYLAAFLRRHRHDPTLLVTRDPAGLELVESVRAVRPAAGLRMLFEVHKLAFLTKASHQQARGRDLASPEVAAKVERRRQLEASVYAAVDGIICTSESARRMLGEHFAAHAPACVVPNGTQVSMDGDGRPLVASRLDDRARDLDLVYVGQLYKWKGIDGLVRAMVHVPGAHLTVVGGQDPEDLVRLQDLAQRLGVAARIDFVGQVAPHRVAGFMARARVGVIPLPAHGYVEAEHFTSPLKAFELMRAGVPIVASDLASTREILRHDVTAWLVPPDDPIALAAGLVRVREDRALAARLVAAAAEQVLDYTWAARARRMLAFAAGLEAVPAVEA